METEFKTISLQSGNKREAGPKENFQVVDRLENINVCLGRSCEGYEQQDVRGINE